jgi:hypothetical protein
MRTFLFVILICAIKFNILAQSFQPILGKQNTKWIYLPEALCDGFRIDSIKTIGDSTIENIKYLVVSRKNDTVGFLREDTILGRMWLRKKTEKTDRLLIDLTLKENDTFLIKKYPDITKPIVVDSVFFLNGKKHIKFKDLYINLCGPMEQFEFIEGVGPNAGLLFEESSNGYIFSYLLCSQRDGTYSFNNKSFNGNCYPKTVDVKKIKNNYFSSIVSYNSLENDCNIRFENSLNTMFTFYLYSIEGRLKFKLFTQNSEIRFNTTLLKKGLYLYKLVGKQNEMSFGKVIIK